MGNECPVKRNPLDAHRALTDSLVYWRRNTTTCAPARLRSGPSRRASSVRPVLNAMWHTYEKLLLMTVTNIAQLGRRRHAQTRNTQQQTSSSQPGKVQPIGIHEALLLCEQSMYDLPLSPEHCSPTKCAHLSLSATREGEGEGGMGEGDGEGDGVLDTQLFTTSAL